MERALRDLHDVGAGLARMDPSPAADHRAYPIRIQVGSQTLDGELTLPSQAGGVVLFADGSGSGRHCPRNRLVADVLNEGGFATLLLDLLTPTEAAVDRDTGLLGVDVDLLAERLVAATDWLDHDLRTAGLSIGYFGASTSAGAALIAAVERPDGVGAVVSRGGRPDLAERVLPLVEAPTLLIVGGDDQTVIELNRRAMARLGAAHMLEVVPGAGHLFEEPGALEQVAGLALAWFEQFLTA